MALRHARASVARRSPRALPRALAQRTVLILLPHTAAALDAAWGLVARLGVPADHLVLVQTGAEAGEVPERFAGRVRHVGPDAHDWRRLPSVRARQGVWARPPDVALSMAPPSDLGALLLAGASPAAVRVGFHDLVSEPFYDLMVSGAPDGADAIQAVERLLRRLDPPIVPFV